MPAHPSPTATVDLLVIGAGPYGLSAAACARRAGIDVRIVGEPMGFWKRHMPDRMLLRSGRDWHLDAHNVHTLDAYLDAHSIRPETVEPLPVELFRDYGRWFEAQERLTVEDRHVDVLTTDGTAFEARFADGGRVRAQAVVAAAGFRPFAHVPERLATLLPSMRRVHTCDLVRFDELSGCRVLIVGGRQSAFEWAALIHERGADEVHVVYRHETPRFEPSDWTWTDAMVERSLREPGWFRSLAAAGQEEIRQRFWTEGRLKLEPWLAPRIDRPGVRLWPGREIRSCHDANGALAVTLGSDANLVVDTVVLATGYRVDVTRIPYLARPLAEAIATTDGFPVLDHHFQASVPNLFLPGLTASRDFGPFFGFVRGSTVAARLITDYLARRPRPRAGPAGTADRGVGGRSSR